MWFHVTCSMSSVLSPEEPYTAATSKFQKPKRIDANKGSTRKKSIKICNLQSMLTMLLPSTSVGMQNYLFFEKCCPPNMFFCIFYIILMKNVFSPFWLLVCLVWMGVDGLVHAVIKCCPQDIFFLFTPHSRLELTNN